MPPGRITKQELKAFTEAITEYAVAQEKTAEALNLMTHQLEKIVNRLYNGIAKEITTEAAKTCEACKDILVTGQVEQRTLLDKIHSSIGWIKIFAGVFAFATIMGVAVSQIIHWATTR